MRVLTLALSALGVANFAVGGVVPSKATPSPQYAHPSGPNLSRTIPPKPTRSIHTAPIFKRGESSPTVTAFTPSCSPGNTYLPTTVYSYTSCNDHGESCLPINPQPTSSCIQTMCKSGSTPYLPVHTETSCTEITTKPKEPVTTSCTTQEITGPLSCHWTSPDFGGTRSQRFVADFAARITQDLGGRSQRAVARFAEPTITTTTITTTSPAPTACPSGEDFRPPVYSDHKCSYNWNNQEVTCSTWTTTWNDGVSTTCTKTPFPHWRSQRLVAQFAGNTQDLGGRSQRAVVRFAEATTTDNKGGRSQRYVVDFAEATVTAKAEVERAGGADAAFPTCSFDEEKGEYVCPGKTQTPPICYFNSSKGLYDCPTPVAGGGGAMEAMPTTLKTVEKKN